MIRRRLHLAVLVVACALALGFGLPLIGLLFGAGIGLIVAGMYGFILGGFANLYLLRIVREPHQHDDPALPSETVPACGRMWESIIDSENLHACLQPVGHDGAHQCGCGSEFR